jgi:toxin FitB
VSYLVDTNVLSEVVKPRPDARVTRWMREASSAGLFVSVLTLGEIRRGVERLEAGPRRTRLVMWLEGDVRQLFEERVLPIDFAVADRWGRLLSSVGRPVPAIDSLLAATALHHDLRFATRNARDFDFPGLEVVSPWAS